jgi:hypothetical protein
MKVFANIYESRGYLPLIYSFMKKTIPDQMDKIQFARGISTRNIWVYDKGVLANEKSFTTFAAASYWILSY